MAKVPYQPVPEVAPVEGPSSDPYVSPNVSPSSFGEGFAEGLGKLGESVTKVGNLWNQVQKDRKVNDFYTATEDDMGKFLQMNGDEAINHAPELRERIRDRLEAGKSALSFDQAVSYDAETRNYVGRYVIGRIDGKVAEETKKIAGATTDAGIERGAQMAAGATNDAEVKAGLDVILENTGKKVHVEQGITDPNSDVFKQKYAGFAAIAIKNRIETIGAGDPKAGLGPAAALKEIEKYKGLLSTQRTVAGEPVYVEIKRRFAAAAKALNRSQSLKDDYAAVDGAAARNNGSYAGAAAAPGAATPAAATAPPPGGYGRIDQSLAIPPKDQWPAGAANVGRDEKTKLPVYLDKDNKPLPDEVQPKPAAEPGITAAPPEKVEPASYTPPAEGATPAAAPIDASSVYATGYGQIYHPYTAALDAKGAGGFSAGEMFQYLRAQGASTNEAILLTSAAANESALNPRAWHDKDQYGNPTGYGLFGHKFTRLNLVGVGWQEQARAALGELRGMEAGKMANEANSIQALTAAEMAYESPRGYRAGHPEAGDNYRGRLGTMQYFSRFAKGIYTGSDGAPIKGHVISGGMGGPRIGGVSPMLEPGYGYGMATPEVPEPAALEQPAGGETQPQTTAQRAAYQQGPDSKLSPDELSAAEAMAQTARDRAAAMKARILMSDDDDETKNWKLSEVDRILKAQIDAFEMQKADIARRKEEVSNAWHDRQYNGDYNGALDIIEEARRAKRIDATTADEWRNSVLERENKDLNSFKGPEYNDAMHRITLPYGDPRKIHTQSQIDDLYTPKDGSKPKISDKAYDELSKHLKEHKATENEGGTSWTERLNSVRMVMRKELTYATEAEMAAGVNKDPKGPGYINTGNQMLDGAWNDWRKAGNDPEKFPYWDSDKAKDLAHTIRSAEELAYSRQYEEAGGNALAMGPPPGFEEKADVWHQIISDPPMGAMTGRPIPIEKWAHAVDILLTRHNVNDIANFNALYQIPGPHAQQLLVSMGIQTPETANYKPSFLPYAQQPLWEKNVRGFLNVYAALHKWTWGGI